MRRPAACGSAIDSWWGKIFLVFTECAVKSCRSRLWPKKEEDAAMKTIPGVSIHSKLRTLALGVAIATFSAPALAAESWFACDGNVVTKKGAAAETSATANDIYALNDEVRALYKWSPQRKTLDLISTTTYDPKSIVWVNVGKGIGSQTAHWEGRIDRANMSLKIVREDGDEMMTWTQQCKPTTAPAS
jgi:hypothetical protein